MEYSSDTAPLRRCRHHRCIEQLLLLGQVGCAHLIARCSFMGILTSCSLAIKITFFLLNDDCRAVICDELAQEWQQNPAKKAQCCQLSINCNSGQKVCAMLFWGSVHTMSLSYDWAWPAPLWDARSSRSVISREGCLLSLSVFPCANECCGQRADKMTITDWCFHVLWKFIKYVCRRWRLHRVYGIKIRVVTSIDVVIGLIKFTASGWWRTH